MKYAIIVSKQEENNTKLDQMLAVLYESYYYIKVDYIKIHLSKLHKGLDSLLFQTTTIIWNLNYKQIKTSRYRMKPI